MGDLCKCDVLVIGGGPAGSIAASVLAAAHISVALIEGSHYEVPRVGEHLPPKGAVMLTRLGLAHVLRSSGAVECPGVRAVWGKPQPHYRDYLFDLAGRGWHLDRSSFDKFLAAEAEAVGAGVFRATRLHSIDWNASTWDITLAREGSTRHVFAKIIIDASGRDATVARRLGARRVRFDSLFGVACWFERYRDPDLTLLVEAFNHGWWYSLPLPGDRIICVLMTDADFLKDKGWRSIQPWNDLLSHTRYTRERLRLTRLTVGPVLRPADSAILHRLCGPGWLAIGDAAMSVDPLSSGGITDAIETALAGAKAALSQINGDDSALEEYAAQQFARFHSYLLARTKVYREELRWPDDLFWRRRHTDFPSVFLSPDDLLTLNENSRPSEPVELKGSDRERLLLDFCGRSWTPAHAIVRYFQSLGEADEDVVVALQHLIVSGVLKVNSEPRIETPSSLVKSG